MAQPRTEMPRVPDPNGPSTADALAEPGPAARAAGLAAAIPGVTLGRRLASFRATRDVAPPREQAVQAGTDLASRLAAAVAGEVIDGPDGRVVRVDAGSIPVPLDRVRLHGLPGQPAPDRRLVCLDTETTGLGTGAGTVAWVVGVGHWDGHRLRVVQLLLPDHADEGALLRILADEIGEDPVLVTYNGRSFDWPLLVARYRLHGRPAPMLGGHLDLLPVVRRLFRHRLGGARLRTVEEGLLSVARHDDVEGWEIPSLYLDFLRGGPAAPIARVARHNAEDIRSLGRLLAHLDVSLADPSGRAAADPGDLASLAEMLRLHGRHDEALACLDRALATIRSAPSARPAARSWSSGPRPAPAATAATRDPRPVPSLFSEGLPWWSPRVRADIGGPPRAAPHGVPGSSLRRPVGPGRSVGEAPSPADLVTVLAARARALRRLERHAEAAAAWEEVASVAGGAGVAAWVEVAKIREHVERDAGAALAATERALALLARRRAAGLPAPAAESGLLRRRARLARRIARQQGARTARKATAGGS
jgi:uncharacterized protein YprB with RNaseH-like and TPR domain